MLLLILLSGVIERKPGPVMIYTQVLQILQSKEYYLKYAHLNFQDIRRKQNGLKNLSMDLGLNTVLAITETWLTKKDEFKTWDISPNTHKCFRYDRKCVDKTKGGGILLYIPFQLEPKELPDLYLCETELFESIWIEFELPQLASHVNKVLLNVSYNPQKSLSGLFLENLSKSIEVAMLKTSNIVLMGDYNIDYLNQPEQNHHDSVLNHFALNVCCLAIPKRVGKTSETHIDYIIKEKVQNSFVFDVPFKTDHFASILFGSEKMRDRKPIEKNKLL